jgi:predicted Zn finger-like uncharacterized protein
MTLITRCPACGTLFKVVADQLRISEGWVRCGHCSEVFDATEHMTTHAAAPSAAAAQPAQEPEPLSAQFARAPEPASTAGHGMASEEFPSSLNTEVGESTTFDGPDSVQLEAEARALVEDPLDRPFEFRRRDESELETSLPSRGRDSSWRPAADSGSGFGAQSQSDSELEDVSFIREARRKAFWTRPAVRAGLLVVACALGVLLALQVAVQERDRLAAGQPALKPWLARMCALLECRVAAPRQIDAISIDSSSFNKLPGDAYRLNVTLKNQAGIELAMPALELTLTDVQDRPVVRRVLLPTEMRPGANVIGAASEWTASLSLGVANGSGERIAGYRLLAFYP